jgi:hypothetical protein
VKRSEAKENFSSSDIINIALANRTTIVEQSPAKLQPYFHQASPIKHSQKEY